MATGTEGGRSFPQPVPQASHRGAPAPNVVNAVSPPSKRELASWWKKFRKTAEKEEEKVNAAPGIFNVPLSESIRYANVAISLTNEQGESFIYGYVPIVVAKCGVFLKEKATDVEGIFRLSGSAKRIKDLENVFNSPDRYGKGLDWTGYTVHDAANILRRYLNKLPEPIVPLEQYERFRDPLRSYQQRLEKQQEGQPTPEISASEHALAVAAYQKLITQLPALHRQLLLYLLDLLAVFSSKSDLNRMTAANLAAIFQPGIISHPDHDMAPHEYRLSQDVLIFLIENQDNFLIGMSGTGLDEKTQKDVESGSPSMKTPQTNIGRSASNASAGADSLRKYGLRRNVSVSSHTSRERTSPNISSPGTPASPSFAPGSGSIGVARSNTVPSKRSPAVGQHRFQRTTDSPAPASPVIANASSEAGSLPVTPGKSASVVNQGSPTPAHENIRPQSRQGTQESATVPFPEMPAPAQAIDVQQNQNSQHPTLQVPQSQAVASQQTRDRKISNIFSKSPVFGPSDPQQSQQQRQPKKLQKRQKIPGATLESAQSSAASLQGDEPFHTPMMSPDLTRPQTDPIAVATKRASTEQHAELSPPHTQSMHGRGSVTQKSPATSLRSGTSITDHSDFDALDDHAAKPEKSRSRWRFSSSARKPDDGPLAPPPPIGQNAGARTSNSSIGSSSRPRQSFTAESQSTQQFGNDYSSIGQRSVTGVSSHESYEPLKEGATEPERRGLFGKLKAKMAQSKEERREREAEKERAKSPPRMTGDNSSSRHSLSAIAHDHFTPRGRSVDKTREDVLPTVTERPMSEAQAANKPTPTNAVQVPVTAQAVASQPASSEAPAPPAPLNLVSAAPAMGINQPLPNSSQDVVLNGSGPTSAPISMPVVAEEPALEIQTQTGEIQQPDSVQHTPTEIKGLPMGK